MKILNYYKLVNILLLFNSHTSNFHYHRPPPSNSPFPPAKAKRWTGMGRIPPHWLLQWLVRWDSLPLQGKGWGWGHNDSASKIAS